MFTFTSTLLYFRDEDSKDVIAFPATVYMHILGADTAVNVLSFVCFFCIFWLSRHFSSSLLRYWYFKNSIVFCILWITVKIICRVAKCLHPFTILSVNKFLFVNVEIDQSMLPEVPLSRSVLYCKLKLLKLYSLAIRLNEVSSLSGWKLECILKSQQMVLEGSIKYPI